MPEFPVEVTISRASGGPLVLSCDTGYYIARNGIGPGEASWRRNTVSSPFVDGRVLVSAVRDVGNIIMKVRVEGTSSIDLHTKMQTLIAALSQYSYTIQVEIDGVVYAWACEPADWTIGDGGQWEDLYLRQYMQNMSFSIPRHPGSAPTLPGS